MSGMKFDKGKLEWSLLPFKAVEQVIGVLMYGAVKYDRDNWKKVENWQERYWNAAIRHLVDHKKGEDLEPESGLTHLAHACCCLLFLLAMGRVSGDLEAALEKANALRQERLKRETAET